MGLAQSWGKLLAGERVLYGGELFIAHSSGASTGWSVTFASLDMIEGLLAADPIVVELIDGRRGNATFAKSYNLTIDFVFKLDGCGKLA